MKAGEVPRPRGLSANCWSMEEDDDDDDDDDGTGRDDDDRTELLVLMNGIKQYHRVNNRIHMKGRVGRVVLGSG